MNDLNVLGELFLGRTFPERRVSNAEVKECGLESINLYRAQHNCPPLASLPRAHPGMGYDVCLIGACLSDLPSHIDHAKQLSEDVPAVQMLELRFERMQLPELVAVPGEMPRLVYAESHDYALIS